MSTYSDLIPVNVLTGALGSGKTTLLRALLRAPRLTGTMVLVNELGEVGIDHHLIEHASESTLLLENGCLCCAMREDLKTALKDLHSRRARGVMPRYERIVVETTGVADPVPIAYTLLTEPVLQHHYRLGNVVTVVDAVNAPAQLARYEESVRQVALADRLVVSKLDLGRRRCPGCITPAALGAQPGRADRPRRLARSRSGRAADHRRLRPAVEKPRSRALDALDPGHHGSVRRSRFASGRRP